MAPTTNMSKGGVDVDAVVREPPAKKPLQKMRSWVAERRVAAIGESDKLKK
eukprot:CAMPEP_0118707794 /NCGR_PEP_ID=MMETSP0800-20121206/21447_1 /TAXON_ID=210618 ORGANISM="Striatella unipunctata, Strain CCMP2910" /NCGR_SAMPLE_ID=MMETSP0800 /ASSEMBLY_ACC=CAM_ASM_000638 /LENGTH=50 /DNA_ID=CAMNT_0006610751 /DNA_START=172 /DNA_END=324 /DNA_ORIENTATION=+